MPDAPQICPRCGRMEPADADFCYCGFIFPKPGQRGSVPPVRAIPLTIPAAPSRSRGLIWQLGQASLAAPLVSFVVSCLGRPLASAHAASAIVILVVVWGLPVFGLVAAVITLVGIGKHGSKGLLVPGLMGLLLNGGIIAAIVYMRGIIPAGHSGPRSGSSLQAPRRRRRPWWGR